MVANLANTATARQGIAAIDGTVLERARTLWQVGDWQALAAIGQQPIEGHPLRERLAVLIATAHHQLGRFDEASRFIDAAQAWGCPREVMLSAFVAGALNSLGRAHALRGRGNKADARFAEALAIGFPGSEHPMITLVRASTQYRQIGLQDTPQATLARATPHPSEPVTSMPASRSAATTRGPSTPPGPNFAALDRLLESGLAGRLPVDDADACAQLLQAATNCLGRALGRLPTCELTLSTVRTSRAELRLLHVKGDYIPEKVVRERKFYENEFLELLENFHQPETLIIDVGANVGNHTLFFSKVLGATVLAFEPEPHNLLCLELNLQLNGVRTQVTTQRFALGDAVKQVELTMAIGQNFGSFSNMPELNPNHNPKPALPSCTVPSRRLDEALADQPSALAVGLLKIDVEGMELEVLRGATATLREHRPLVAVECFNSQVLSQIDALLTPLGYSPIALVNATPTFVYVSESNRYHAHRLRHHLRKGTLASAAQRQGFITSR